MNKKYTGLVIMLLIAYILVTMAAFTSKMLQFIAPSEAIIAYMSIQLKLFSFIFYFFSLSVNIGCSVWLFLCVRKEKKAEWLWASLGLFAGLLAVLLWYITELHNLIKMGKNNEEEVKRKAEGGTLF